MSSKKHRSIKTITISVCTYQRPNQLRQAIRSVKELVIPTDLSATLLVIDNSPSKEVRRIFEEETRELKIPADYVEEGKRGIVHARNRMLSEVESQNSDYLALFDDDDRPDSEWLVNLWVCLQTYSATVVSGKMAFIWPASCRLDEEVRRVYDNALGNVQTGDIRQRCGSGNTLLDLQFVKAHNLRFNTLFNLTGGEDSHFFELMTVLGAKIVRCNEAVVYSDIVDERANEDYIWRRRYNIGYVEFQRDQILQGKFKARRKTVSLLIRNCFRISLTYFSKSKEVQVKRKKRMIESKGLWDSLIGVKYENYATTDGS